MSQDFWASSGYRDLERVPGGLKATPAWLARFPAQRGTALRGGIGAWLSGSALHARVQSHPLVPVDEAALTAIEDPDARDNWREFLRFRDRVLAFPTLEAAYRDLFKRPEVDLAPPFVDALVQAIVRLLDDADAAARAGELFFRRQRLAGEDGQVLVADAATLQAFHDTGGFGSVGKLLRRQSTALPEVKMDVLNAENAGFYFARRASASRRQQQGARRVALATVLERWVAHMTGAEVAIEPVARVDDPHWRWHLGLDVDSSAILDALYRGEEVPPENLERLALLFALRFRDDSAILAEMRGKPVYLGLGCRPDRSLKMKPQNLVLNLPLAPACFFSPSA